jgi:predicted metal-dependent HD superfamily phosphohydrolase
VILVDPPRWPAHDTVFSHLVSDTSLSELHDLASRIGMNPRAFDHDHYDLPQRLYDAAVGAGAVAVSAEELVRRLVASGLRVRTPEKTPSRDAARRQLPAHWERLGLGRDLYVELVSRWSEPHRHYHDVRHLAGTLEALDLLEDDAASSPVVQLAAWFHDAVYEGVAGVDEQQSADLAERMLGDLPGHDVDEVVRLVLLTAGHDPQPGDAAGTALCDADLSILGALPGRYDVYVRDVRLDYSHIEDASWAVGRTAVLDSLLALNPLYRTPMGQELWQERAAANLTRERARWTRLGERTKRLGERT